MAGLLTLNSESLGRLDADVLGGAGTGFAVGTNTSTGSAAGFIGYTGNATGPSVSSGSASGLAGRFGITSGNGTQAGSAVGTVGAFGVTLGTATNTGVANGAADLFGIVAGSNTTAGSNAGTPYLSGNATGEQVSTGSASGFAPTPPTPPTPTPAPTFAGGGNYQRYIPKPQAVAAFGAVAGSSASSGSVQARRAANGSALGLSMSIATVTGSSRLDVAPIRYIEDTKHRRRKAEDQLLILELL